MVDLAGRVIGVAVATSQAEGISFGIPIEDARAAMAAALAGQPIP
jgi:S1-C subfamily serine protease